MSATKRATMLMPVEEKNRGSKIN